MPRDSNGNTQPLGGTIVSRGDDILPSQHNPAIVDIYDMISQSLSRDGQGGMRANLNMNGFRITNVANGTDPKDVATVGQIENSVPIGVVMDFAGQNPPNGWMLCHGQSLSRTEYARLFSAIGTSFGGSGSNFNLPDARGRVIAGRDNMGGSSAGRMDILSGQQNNVGGAGGVDQHALTINQMPVHSHSGSTNSAGRHSHGISRGPNYGRLGIQGSQFIDNAGTTEQDGEHVHSFTTNNTGGGAAHINVQPTIIMNKIIKVM